MTAAAAVTVGCDACTGRPAYRVKLEGFKAAEDNFEQLVDHRPILFAGPGWLANVAARREGTATVTRLADANQAKDVVIAYAGPSLTRTYGRQWLVDPPASGLIDDLIAARESAAT